MKKEGKKIWREAGALFNLALPMVHLAKQNKKLDHSYYTVLRNIAGPVIFTEAMQRAAWKLDDSHCIKMISVPFCCLQFLEKRS